MLNNRILTSCQTSQQASKIALHMMAAATKIRKPSCFFLLVLFCCAQHPGPHTHVPCFLFQPHEASMVAGHVVYAGKNVMRLAQHAADAFPWISSVTDTVRGRTGWTMGPCRMSKPRNSGRWLVKPGQGREDRSSFCPLAQQPAVRVSIYRCQTKDPH